jgi:transcription elongation factor Elf1
MPILYECEHCDYMSTKKSNFTKHLNRKKSCRNTNENSPSRQTFSCPKCDYRVLSQKGMTQHLKVCNGHNPLMCSNCKATFTTRVAKNKHIKNVKCVYVETAVQQTTLATVNDAPSSSTIINNANNINTSNNTNINITNNIQNNITINALGSEDISYLTDKGDFNKFMARCFRLGPEGLCNFLLRKHFDKEHPENHNLRKMNKKDDFIEYHDGNDWQIGLYESVLDQTFDSMKNIFVDFVDSYILDMQVLNRRWVDTFVKRVAEPLDWDFSSNDYDYELDESMTDEQKDKIRNRIFRLAVEHIYRQSKSLSV